MESLIITAIAVVLGWFGILPPPIVVLIGIVSYILMLVGMTLYFRYGFMKIYYHDVLRWHTPDNSPKSYDGCSLHGKCRYCGKDIMQDSQGNWFTC